MSAKVDTSPDWAAYRAAPTGQTLGPLLRTVDVARRDELVRAVEELFFETANWRVAQHASNLHLDTFQPQVQRRDVVRALFFAVKACDLSKNDPRALIVMARVSWERRLPLAVLHYAQTAIESLPMIRPEVGETAFARLVGESEALLGIAYAYLKQPLVALPHFLEAQAHSSLTGARGLECLVQLLLGSDNERDALIFVARHWPPAIALGGRAQHRLRQAFRRLLLDTLDRRP